MLTKKDLSQIKELLVELPTKEEVKQVVKQEIQKELMPIKEDIAQIRKDMKTISNFFDQEYLELRKRIERIEETLKLPPMQ